MELRSGALRAFGAADPEIKMQAVQALWQAAQGGASADAGLDLAQDIAPGRPDKPELVQPKTVPRRSPFTPEGHAALMHSIAHIEFNAVKTVLNISI